MTSQLPATTGAGLQGGCAATAADLNEPTVLHTKATNVQSKPETEPVACKIEAPPAMTTVENTATKESSQPEERADVPPPPEGEQPQMAGTQGAAIPPASTSATAKVQAKSPIQPAAAQKPANRSPKFQKTPYECFVTAFRKEFKKKEGSAYDEKEMRKQAHEHWAQFGESDKVVFQQQAELLQEQKLRREQKVRCVQWTTCAKYWVAGGSGEAQGC